MVCLEDCGQVFASSKQYTQGATVLKSKAGAKSGLEAGSNPDGSFYVFSSQHAVFAWGLSTTTCKKPGPLACILPYPYKSSVFAATAFRDFF